MPLKLKTFLILLFVFLIYSAVSYEVHLLTMMPGFIELEHDKALSNLERVRGAIEQEIRRLDAFSHDWAAWDDTYDFVLSRNANYITSNLVDETFRNANIDLLYIFDTGGNVVWGGIILPGAETPTSWAMVPPEGLLPDHPLLPAHDPDIALSEQHVTGMVMNNEIPLVIAARPILTSSNEGPSRGTVIMGSFLGDKMLKRLTKQIRVEFEIMTDPDIVLSFDERSAKGDYISLPYLIKEQDLELLQVYGVYRDLMGKAAFVVKTTVLREISIHGRQYIRYGFLSIMTAGLVALLVMLWILQRTVLNPIGILTRHILDIERAGDYSTRLAPDRDDEIGILGKTFDRMLDTIELQTKKLKTLSTEDGLTGLANRRCFDEYLALEWTRMRRERRPVSLILCDVDFFKLFNDTYGHQAGDGCLRNVARALSGQVRRQADLAARYGGEEFAVITPGTDMNGAAQVADSIRMAVRQLRISHSQSSVDKNVSISAGISSLIPSIEDSPEKLIELADKALYEAKKQGRNRICRAEE